MSMLEMLMKAGGGAAVQQIGGRFGLSPDQTQAAMGQLLPAVMGGFKKQAAAPGGLEGLVAALGQTQAARVDAEPDMLGRPEATDIGNAVLGQIFGSKDVSRSVAGQAAQATGLSDGVMKQLLPLVAAMAAGQLGQQAGGAAGGAGGLGGMIAGMMGGGQPQAGGLGGLAQMLDLDKDGNPLDDIMGLASQFLGKR